jgi:dipeptidyl aminopeptidase/acylaminoacyl peptidase
MMRAAIKPIFCLSVLFAFFIYCQNSFAQQEIVTPPQTLTVEGIPSLPKKFEDDFKSLTRRKTSTFISWTKAGSVLGYSNYYEPFLINSPLVGRTDIELTLQDPDRTALQPVNEKSFLYTKDNDGDENTQIFKYDLETKQSTQLTQFPEIQFVNSYLWTDDGNSIYFLNQKKKENLAEIYSLNPQTKEKKKLVTLNGDTHFLVDVNNDFLLFSHYLSNNHTVYYLLDPKNSQITQLTSDVAYFKEGKFSRDGRGLWWLSDIGGNFFDIYYYDLAKKTTTKVNKSEFNISDFAFSPDESLLALKVNESGADNIRIFEVDGTEIKKEVGGPKLEPGVIEKLSWRNNEEIGFGYESVKIPSEIRSFNVKTGSVQVWGKGDVNKEIADQLQDTRLIKWKSFDNREITGFLLAPKQSGAGKKLPVLIDIHGGPKDQYQPYFNSYRIYSVAKLQTAVIFPNIRGSSGFGKEFENLDNKEKRVDALKDLRALLDWIKTQPELDSNRVVVKGTSYGGFMALALGLKEQNRLKGVIAEVPPVSIKNYIDKSVKSLQDIYAFEYGQTSDQKLMEQTENLSLLSKNNLDNWKIPILLTAGQNDVRVPIEDMEKLKDLLKSKNIPVWFLKAKNEGHFWSDYDNNVFLELSKIAFFIKYGN